MDKITEIVYNEDENPSDSAFLKYIILEFLQYWGQPWIKVQQTSWNILWKILLPSKISTTMHGWKQAKLFSGSVKDKVVLFLVLQSNQETKQWKDYAQDYLICFITSNWYWALKITRGEKYEGFHKWENRWIIFCNIQLR